jgi:HK97 family phage prohead protease
MTETRIIKAAELRSSGKQIYGLAAPYNVRTTIRAKGGKFLETIKRGAFDRVLRSKPDVLCLFNHNPDYVLGRTSAGTLRLDSSNRGLEFECDLPDSQMARELHQSIERRDIAGNSFGFTLEAGDDSFDEDYDEDRNRTVLRTIRNVATLVDVSPVTSPAYQGTELAARCQLISAEVRSQLARFPRTKPSDFELLRDQLREVAYWDSKMDELRAPAAVTARRRNLLNQV